MIKTDHICINYLLNLPRAQKLLQYLLVHFTLNSIIYSDSYLCKKQISYYSKNLKFKFVLFWQQYLCMVPDLLDENELFINFLNYELKYYLKLNGNKKCI